MTVGLAMLGPVGLVAGAYLGSKAGSKAAGGSRTEEEKPPRQSEDEILGLKAPTDSNILANQPTPSQQSADLLGLNNQMEASLTTTEPLRSPPAAVFQHTATRSHAQQVPGFEQTTGVSVPTAPDFLDTTHDANDMQATLNDTKQQQAARFTQNQTTQQQYNPLGVQRQQQEQQQNLFAPQTDRYGNSFQLSTPGEPGTAVTQYPSQNPMSPMGQGSFRAGNVTQTQSAFYPSSSPLPNQQYAQQHYGQSQPQTQINQSRQFEQQPTQGYRFGDATRSIINAGKKKRGGKKEDGYKFGDFTRGLFGSGR